MSPKHRQVIIAGGGPTGLMLAAELALAGVDVAIVERRPTQEVAGSRAGGLHARTLEILDQRGIAERFLAQGQTFPTTSYGWIPMNIADLPTRHPYVLALGQPQIERILAEWVSELGVPIYRGKEVTGFTQDDTGVAVTLTDGSALRADYLVGCDGGRSLVRKTAGIDFPGWDPTIRHIIAEVEFAGEPEWGLVRDAHGIRSLSKAEGGLVRVMVTEQHPGRNQEPTLQDLSEELISAYGTDFGVRNPTWISRFTDSTRQAARYRDRRVFLAGDAAHVHYPVGGHGLQTGVQDAVNLGWKLAQVLQGTSPDSLLDTYHAERHPAGARVLKNTMAQIALLRADERTNALRDTVAELIGNDQTRQRLAAEATGLDVHYELGKGHPLLGRRMPDLDLETPTGPTRVSSLLHDARPVLLNLGEPGKIDMASWAGRVRFIDATFAGVWDLPALGDVPAPSAVLVRPDGHVAWLGEGSSTGLPDALATWFGPPAPA